MCLRFNGNIMSSQKEINLLSRAIIDQFQLPEYF